MSINTMSKQYEVTVGDMITTYMIATIDKSHYSAICRVEERWHVCSLYQG